MSVTNPESRARGHMQASTDWSFLRNFQEAQCVPLDLSNVCDGNMLKLIVAHADAVGVAKESIFLNLLACVSGFMGKSQVLVNDEWKEQCALWCAIGVRKGLKKSSTITRFVNAMEGAGCRADEGYGKQTNRSQEQEKYTPHIHTDYMDGDEFRGFYDSSVTGSVGLYEDVSVFLQGVLNSKHPSQRLRLKRMYDINSDKSKVPALSLNGFVRVNQLREFLEDTDISGRFLLMCPAEEILHSTEYKVPMPTNTPSLKEIFRMLAQIHSTPIKYRLSEPALMEFIQYYDSLIPKQKQAMEAGNEQSSSILAKAPGQMLRLACVLGALRQALKIVVYHEDTEKVSWNTSITRDDMEGAKLIWEHVLTTKVILLQDNMMPKAAAVSGASTSSASMARPSPASRKRPAASSVEEDHLNALSQAHSLIAHSVKAESMMSAAAQSSEVQRLSQAYGIPLNLGSPVFPEMINLVNFNSKTFQQQNPQNIPNGSNNQTMAKPDGGGSPNIVTHNMNSPLFQAANARSYQHGMKMEAAYSYEDLEDDDDSDISPILSVQPVFDKDALNVELTDEETNAFISKYGDRIKKLLEYKNDFKITPSTCAQRHLMPPLSKRDMMRLDTQTRFPVVWAKQFLNIVAKMGFGTIEVYLHPSNNRQSHYFQKKRYEDLGPKVVALLAKLRVTEHDFKAGFFHPNDGAPVPHVYVSRPYVSPSLQQQRSNGNRSSVSDHAQSQQWNAINEEARKIAGAILQDGIKTENGLGDEAPHLDESMFSDVN